MKEIGLLFTIENRALTRAGLKTQTRRARGLEGLESAVTADWDNKLKAWVFCDEKGYAFSYRKCPYGNPQIESTRYYGKEPTQILASGETYPEKMLVKYLDDRKGSETIWLPITESDSEKIQSRQDPFKATSSLFMLKNFARTWLPGIRTWPERLGNMSDLDAICEGIFQQQNLETGEKRYGIHSIGLWSYKSPLDAYRMLWDSINGSGSWKAEKWTWAIEWEAPVQR